MAHRIPINISRNTHLQSLVRKTSNVNFASRFFTVNFSSIADNTTTLAPVSLHKGHMTNSIRCNSQHRVILLPEIPDDDSSNNPILRQSFNNNIDENSTNTEEKLVNVPDYNMITERNCYFGLGKAILQYETAVSELEQKCEDGIEDFDTLFKPFEQAICNFQSVRNSVSLLNLATDKLDRDRMMILNARAEAAFANRFNSKAIYKTLKKIQSDFNDGTIILDEHQKMSLDKNLREYNLNGYDLPERKYLELTTTWLKRLAETRKDYDFRIMTSTERFRYQIKDPNTVRDFPIDVLKAMAYDSTQPTKGPWTVTLHPYIYKQVMSYSPERSLRWRIHQADVTRGGRSATDIYTQCQSQVRDLRIHRFDVAITLGFKNFAEYKLQTAMAMDTNNVDIMISSLLSKAKQHQESELEQLQAYGSLRGFDDDIEVYDVEFLKRKQRRTILGMSDEDFRDYLPLPKVITGIFKLCESLFDLRFEEIKSLSNASEDVAKILENKKWAPDIKLYRIIDVAEGGANKVLGQFFLDPYVRDDKGYAGGDKGWYLPIRPHSSIVGSEALGAMVLSLPIPNFGKPSLLSVAEVEEVLRNFGNLLVHVCSSKTCKWADLCGRTGLEWDVIDVAGIFMTHWLYVPDILRSLSGHWSTNEPLPNNVIEKLCTSAGKHHMAGYNLCNELFRAAYDKAFYSEEYEKESYQDMAERLRPEYLLLPPAAGDCFPIHANDIMSGDYPGTLYSKTWGKMLAADAFSAIQEAIETNGIHNEHSRNNILTDESVKSVTRRFRSTILDRGSSQPYTEMFRQFRGRDPSHEALLLSLGLQSISTPKIKGQKEVVSQ